MKTLAQLSRGVLTVARRRGVGYFGYLLTGVARPQLLYRTGWGPAAPPLLQGAFAAAAELMATRPTPDELRRLGLLVEQGTASSTSDIAAAEIEPLMDRAHAAGVTGVAASFRRVVRCQDGAVRFQDLVQARKHAAGSVRFVASRDADRRAFNRAFGTALLTEESARQSLKALKARVPRGYRNYAPIDFGCGLTVGTIASTDSGTGRWEFFNRRIVGPIVAGKRVLDLGSNNGSLPLMMLRDGAKAVVGIEFTPVIAEFARLNARIVSWRDMRPYDIEIVAGDMRLYLTENLGPFDIVTAFCSLYYLPEDDMARIIAKAASTNAVLVLQANEAIDNLPAKTHQLQRMMYENGYETVQVFRAPDFARPLLVGTTAGARERAQ